MSRRSVIAVVSIFVFSATAPAYVAEKDEPRRAIPRIHHEKNSDVRTELSRYGAIRAASAAADTFVLAEFSFDSAGAPWHEGWIGVNVNAQLDTFCHVADSTELNGGSFGRLTVLDGAQSMWCGAMPRTTGGLCRYETLPGYGNGWEQYFTSKPFAHEGDVTVSYLIRWDVECCDYELIEPQVRRNNGYWDCISPSFCPHYDGRSDGVVTDSFTIADSLLGESVQVRFRFRSDGAFSDEDGYDTDGAYILDNITIRDQSGVIDFQDFESEPIGAKATNDGHWYADIDDSRLDLAAVFPGSSVLQEDGCISNTTGLWGFFNGSTADYSCGGHPEQSAIPYMGQGSLLGQYVNYDIWSPYVDWTQDVAGTPVPESAGMAFLEFDVYRDLQILNWVFYRCKVRSVVDGCPQLWLGPGYVYYGDMKDWYRHRTQIGFFVDPGVNWVQLALGVVDYCQYGYPCATACHSHAPLFDNVRLVRVDAPGFYWRSDVFQDNFASDGTLTGTVPMDGTSSSYPTSVEGWVASSRGVDYHDPANEASGPAVYCSIKDVSPAKSGSVVSGDLFHYPLVSAEGGWTKLRCREKSSKRQRAEIEFAIDLNDNLYEPGDTVWYYFSARDTTGVTVFWCNHVGVTTSEADVRARPMEVTCLPANALGGGTDVLYVDAAGNLEAQPYVEGYVDLGAQPYFETAFAMLGIAPDRFDCRGKFSTRVVDLLQQLVSVYRIIIWNTGDRQQAISFQSPSDEDYGLLFEFLNQSPNRPGVYLSGDNLVSYWATETGTEAVNLRNTYMNFNIVSDSHAEIGEPISPLVIGTPGSCFDHGIDGLDTLIAYGADCPRAIDFDVLQPFGAATVAMAYSGDPSRGAALTQVTQNSVGDTARVMLSGFSYHQIRDRQGDSTPARATHLAAILRWMDNDVGDPIGVAQLVPFTNKLAQNYPNPCNPRTTIEYSIRERGHVSLRIYDVSGRLVSTLVDEAQNPSGMRSVTWDGRNHLGNPVSSGVYFYRLITKDFSQTKKMVVLK